ncbi:MAG: hypothetical protein KBA90_13255 [Chitinophagaceae bacterium]|nr:hypothetical protein [Chitinophagaceae bacterium]MBP7109518.1 hypothetical protein [Chitinophagaceae bacterium]
MASLSFRNGDEDLRISELSDDGKIRFQCENDADQMAWAKNDLDIEDIKLVIEWLQKQIQKVEPKSNG